MARITLILRYSQIKENSWQNRHLGIKEPLLHLQASTAHGHMTSASRTTTLQASRTTQRVKDDDDNGPGEAFMLMGNTWPVGMAGGNTAATLWCSHCGMGLAAPAPGSGPIVRCAFCRGVTRVEHQRGGVGESAMTTRTLAAAASLPRPLPVSAGPVEIPASYPRVSGGNKKRALLVGVSYTGTAHELKGTVNDVKEMRRLLCDRFGFPGACILELTGKILITQWTCLLLDRRRRRSSRTTAAASACSCLVIRGLAERD
jgi:hypothetical protein